METNLEGRFRIMKELDITPNFSELSRIYGIDRHTLKKYWDSGGIPLRKETRRQSMWDPFKDEMIEIFENNSGVSKSAVYHYLINEHKQIKGTYSGFKAYTGKYGIKSVKSEKPHVLYETDPGVQLQADWKEDLKIRLKGGEEIQFNIYHGELSYSRFHVFVYSATRTEDDFKRCTIECFRRIGGITEELETDNMSAIVSWKAGKRNIHPSIRQFMKDLGVKLKLAKPLTPQTKGKNESANRYGNWIIAYNDKLSDESELIRIVEDVIPSQVNKKICQSTRVPPLKLFEKEKEYLGKLPSHVMIDNYITDNITVKVPATLLVYFEGARYSLPPALIGKKVRLYKVDNRLYIYHNQKLAATHNIAQNGTVNYDPAHYTDGLSAAIGSFLSQEKIDDLAAKNLERLAKLQKEKE